MNRGAESVYVLFPDDFPRFKVQRLAEMIIKADTMIPAFVPASVGSLNIEAIAYEKIANKCDYVVVVDRNIASRMAGLARNGQQSAVDPTTKIALDILAFCHAMDITIDPSICFHELAFTQGNKSALEELSWFRAADRGGRAAEWVDFALGCGKAPKLLLEKQSERLPLSRPLRRFQMNYAVMLKSAELSRQKELTAMIRMNQLLNWITENVIVANLATLYASIYFSPCGPKKGAFKGINSGDENRLLQGLKNAAWDATYVGDIVSRLNRQRPTDRVFFATNDRFCRILAKAAFASISQSDFIRELSTFWPSKDAQALALALNQANLNGLKSERDTVGSIQTLVDAAESSLLSSVRAQK